MIRRIGDDNWRDVERQCGVLPRYVPYGSLQAVSLALIPVDQQPDVLVPKDQWKERIEEANAKRMFPIHFLEKAKAPAKNQAWTNYCWAYALASVLEALGLMQGRLYRRLAAATLGRLVNFKNQGYWLTEALSGAKEFGIASSLFAQDGTTDERTFKPGWEADGLNNRPLEWFDTVGVDNRRRNEEEQVHQCVSLLLSPTPLFQAHFWWGHAVMGAGLIWDPKQKYNLRWVAVNSHGDGRIELTGSRGVPDEAYGLRAMTFTP